ncbi:MAG: glycosyltransferase family 1 protein [Bacteroidetes bacterium]|nr:glycosyltransferase family 1 protein [bacterium]NBP66183.1 glycosyltransferase family 1 protein [Bacteroidota bacterium]
MNFLLITGIFPPDIGGPAVYVPKLADTLARKGHEVQVITLGQGNSEENFQNFKVHKIDRSLFKPLRIFLTIWKIRKEISNSDLIFANGLFIETSIANLFSRKRSVYKIVGDPIWEKYRNRTKSKITLDEYQSTTKHWKSFFQRIIFNWAFSRASLITTPSISLAKVVSSWKPFNGVEVIENGTSCHSIYDEEKEFDLIVVSRLVSWKNIDKIIQISARQSLRLLVCGDGPEYENLQSLSKKLEAKVTFVGQVQQSEVTRLLPLAHIYVQISDYEGLSFALLEAMMSGLGIVVSSVPGNSDVIGHLHEGLVVNQRNIGEVEDAIRLLLSDSKLRHKLSENAHKLVKRRYCETTQIEKMILLIEGNFENY